MREYKWGQNVHKFYWSRGFKMLLKYYIQTFLPSVEFIGGAQKRYYSLKSLSTSMLDTHCPNWRNYENPRSYLIPPIFSYKHPEQGDMEYEEEMKHRVEIAQQKNEFEQQPESGSPSTARKPGCQSEVVDYRDGEKAEQVVFDALDELVKSKFASPMIIVHQLDINKIKSSLNAIFPKVCKIEDLTQVTFVREYDFVMIGPKIGLVVIEVKSSHFTGKTDFNDFSNSSAIRKGITQLQSFDTFIDFLKRHPDIRCLEDFPVRKILVLPNLIVEEKDQFDEWKRSIKKLYKIDDVWPGDQPFVTRFQELFDSSLPCPRALVEIGQVNRMDKVAYETLAPIIAGLGSIVVFKGKNKMIKLDLLRLLEGALIKIEHGMIISHNPESLKQFTHEKKIETFSRVFILTPEQEKALAGPNRQFIIGLAGTGKTIVLQQKALQVLREGGKVKILTADCYIEQLKEFIEHENCSVSSWSFFGARLRLKNVYEEITSGGFQDINDHNQINLVLFLQDRIKQIIETFSDSYDKSHLLELSMSRILSDFDSVLIDDACDHVWPTNTNEHRFENLCIAVMLMAYAKVKCPQKTIWVALDPLIPEADVRSIIYHQTHLNLMNDLLKDVQYDFVSVSVLNRIMRHSDNIFQFTYDSSVLSMLKIQPYMGHKIVGPKVTQLSFLTQWQATFEDRRETLWMAVKCVLDQLISLKIPLSFIGILTNEDNVIRIFRQKCEECGISTTSTHRYLLSSANEHLSMDETNMNSGSSDILSICHCFGVSSFEWPVVIFCSTSIPFDCNATERYRAYSRATTKLIVVSLCRS